MPNSTSTIIDYGVRSRVGRSRRWRRDVPGYMFLLPWLVGFFCLTLGPALVSLYLSFTSFDLVRSPRWVGAANYARIATNDAKFVDSLAVTFTYVAVAVPLKICFALGVAVALNKGIRGLPIYRAIFYLPSLLGASVAIAVLWRIIFAGDGLFNHLLAMLGLHLYADNEAHDGYLRDRCVFSPEIDIEDTMHALIEYENGISVNYKLTAYNPCEGSRVTFDGTRGRIEHESVERSHVQTDGSLVRPPLPERARITVQPHFSRAYELALPRAEGLHSGGDKMMLRGFFGALSNDPYGLIADERAGVWSAMVGIAANASLHARIPIVLADLAADLPQPDHVPEPFGPPVIWKAFDPARYSFLAGARLV